MTRSRAHVQVGSLTLICFEVDFTHKPSVLVCDISYMYIHVYTYGEKFDKSRYSARFSSVAVYTACRLDYDTVKSGKWVTTFRRSLSLPFFEYECTTTMGMEAVYTFEMFCAICWTVRCHISDDQDLYKTEKHIRVVKYNVTYVKMSWIKKCDIDSNLSR
jgi:hypothetical protein